MASETDLMRVEVEEGALPSSPPEPESESDYDDYDHLMPSFICPSCGVDRNFFLTSRCDRCGFDGSVRGPHDQG